MKANLGITNEVLGRLRKLPKKVSKALERFIRAFQEDPSNPQLYVHPIKNLRDPKVHGAKLPDGYRAILIKPEVGNNWMMAYIDTHDEAYAWAKEKSFEMHTQTGVFQVYDIQKVEAQIETHEFKSQPITHEYALGKLSEDDLFLAGVPKALLPAVKAIKSDDGFESLADYLPPMCREVLFSIVCGLTLDEALEQALGEKPGTTTPLPTSEGDFSTIDESPSLGITILEQGEESLAKALNRSIEEWRIFLHPSQRSIVKRNTTGPMKITGTAGTGKTVALLHRAVRLARELNETGGPKDKVLLLTFTMNLAYNLKQQLEQLDPDAAKRVTVTNVYSFARTLCQRREWRGDIKLPSELKDVWEKEIESLAHCPLSKDELKEEFERIVDPMGLGIGDDDAYLSTVRTGMKRISRKQRKQVWESLTEFMEHMGNNLTPNGAVRQAYLALKALRETNGDKRLEILPGNFAHVLVDEVQDLSLIALRFLSELPHNIEGPNCLTLAGDGHQRLYRHKFSLRRVGINVVGRSHRLKINYRTTEEIRRWAQAILANQDIDDLDEAPADTRGDRSVMSGPKPEVVTVSNADEEVNKVIDWIERLKNEQHIEYYAMCVIGGGQLLESQLAARNIHFHRVRAKEPDYGSKEPGLRLGSVERIKGLEFKAIAMCGFDESKFNGDDGLHERCKWYVGATRAREYLLVTRCG